MKTKRLPPLSSLQAFEAAPGHESFLNAAAEQNVAPGSISRHVHLLENYLGTELFVRRSNGVALTAAGRGRQRFRFLPNLPEHGRACMNRPDMELQAVTRHI